MDNAHSAQCSSRVVVNRLNKVAPDFGSQLDIVMPDPVNSASVDYIFSRRLQYSLESEDAKKEQRWNRTSPNKKKPSLRPDA